MTSRSFQVMTAYLSLRFAWTDLQRASLQRTQPQSSHLWINDMQYYFVVGANVWYALGVLMMPLLLVLAPFGPRSMLYWHLTLFVQIILSLNIVVNATFYAAHPTMVPFGGQIFRWFHTFISFFLPLCYYIDFIVYFSRLDEGRPLTSPLLPAGMVGTIDMLWYAP